MKNKSYSAYLEDNRDKLKKDGYSDKQIEYFKKKKNLGKVKQSKVK